VLLEDPDALLEPDIRDIEAPPADAQEQAIPINPAEGGQAPHVPFEVDEWDALEQSRVVELDDDYR
jgi:hypothetical protein